MKNDLVNHKSRERLRLAFDTVETACRPEKATISVSNSIVERIRSSVACKVCRP